MENRASYILVGTFVLGLFAAIISVAVWLAGVNLDAGTRRYAIFFEGDVTGLTVGSAVRYRGVPVGTVSEIKLAPENIERVRVVVEVNEETPIKTDTIAQLALQGITGVAYVQLTGGTQQAALLTADAKDALPRIQSRQSVLQHVMTRLPEIIEKVDKAAEGLANLFADENIAALKSTLENIERMSRSVDRGTEQISELVKDARSAANALQKAGTNIASLAATVDGEIKPMSREIRGATTEFRQTLKSADEGIGALSRAAQDIAAVVDDSKGPIRDFAATGLYELSTFLAEARVLVDALTRLSNRIERDPAQFFFGNSQRGVKSR